MSAWYRTGTIAVANGSSTVTGTTTGWLNQVKLGDLILLPDGKFYEIAADAASNTSLTIVGTYAGTTVASGGAYAIARYSDGWRPTAELSLRIANFLANSTDIYSGSGAPSNSLGGDGSAYFRTDLPYLYFKASGAWGAAIVLTGPTGPAGPGYAGTSTTSLLISVASKTLTTQTGLGYVIGTRLRIASNAGSTNYMEGVCTAYNSGTGSLTFLVDRTGGSGTFADWNLTLAGDTGSTGPAGPSYTASSVTSLVIATGSKAFTIASGLAFAVGQRVRAASLANTANFMEGRVSAYSGATLTVTVDVIGGSGTFADWSIGPAGSQGIQGATGPTGLTGTTGATGASYATTSATSFLIGTGSKAFTVAAGLAYLPGARVRIASAANPSVNYMDGFVTAYASTTLTVTVDAVGGSGTLTDWQINLLGPKGDTGATGPTGPTGPAPQYATTSSTSLTVGTGSKAFTVAAGLPYLVGDRLRATSAADTTKVMSGLVASYASTTLTLTVDLIGAGSGTAADWNINLTGEKGDTGAAGSLGSFGVTKGNIPVADGASYGGFAVGANGTIPYADSTQTYGMQWLAGAAFLSKDVHAISTVASAATCDIGAANTDYVSITGTTTITSFGTMANRIRQVTFAAAVLLTYNATSLILPGGVSITTAAGDCATFASDGSGNWRCLDYQPFNGISIATRAPTVQTFTASGTWTKPTGCKFAKFTLVGGGGAGGGAQAAASNCSLGRGGGPGGLCISWQSVLTVASATVTIGAGGSGVSNGTGNNGGNTTVAGTNLTSLAANGGTGGLVLASGTSNVVNVSGASGSASGGQINIGQPVGVFALRISGTSGISGGGGDTLFGTGGAGRTPGSNGTAGAGYGSGGSGAVSLDATAFTGGAGADGLVIVEEFY